MSENKQKRLTRLSSIYSDNISSFFNWSNRQNSDSGTENDNGISFNTATDNRGYTSTEINVENHHPTCNSTYTPIRHQSETFSESDCDFRDIHIMHATDAACEENTDTESFADTVVCNGSKDAEENRKRKNGSIASKFEMAPLLDSAGQVV